VIFGRSRGAASDDEHDADLVPHGVRVASAWSWRLLVIAGLVALVLWLVSQLRLLVIPVLVAVLIAALLVPFANWLQRHRWPKWLAVTVAEVGVLAVVSGLVTVVVLQIVQGAPELQRRTIERYGELQDFLLASPLHLTEADVTRFVDDAVVSFQRDTGVILTGALSVGSTFFHVAAGVLLVLFTTLFILIDGRGIWDWIVRLFPRAARAAVNGAGEAGWLTLTTFVKVQIFVAFVDAVGIGIVAAVLGVPLAVPIAVAVFLGAFVPIVGALVSGTIAVFIALIYLGPIPALIMLAGVLVVQQVEGHVLQPLVMGTAVRIHPLAVVLGVAAGGFIAGIPGTLFAVPLVATLNVMVKYIASGQWRTNPHPTIDDIVDETDTLRDTAPDA
jgi:putative heme transporter